MENVYVFAETKQNQLTHTLPQKQARQRQQKVSALFIIILEFPA